MWYLSRNSKKFGPFTTAQLEALSNQGKLQSTDFVWREGMNDWVLGKLMPEISIHFKELPLRNAKNKIEDDLFKESDNINLPKSQLVKIETVHRINGVKRRKNSFVYSNFYIIFVMLFLVGAISLTLFNFFVTGTGNIIEGHKEWNIINNPDLIIQAKIGIPIEIEPGHFIFF